MGGLLLAAAALVGCSTVPPPSTAENVDLTRYAGKWYEIAKFPAPFQNGLVSVTADYTLLENGTVRVFNRGLKGSFDGPESTISGVAKPADITTNAKLKIRFDPFPVSLFKADYWIIEVGTDYEYAAVSNPSKKYLWILSRTPQMDAAVYDGILFRLTQQGFDTSKLVLTPQP
jgi:apolipoprotein D and lipocalin family protein